ncbi:MAG: hypothetical protein Q9221_002251 [Calogaya cf. arnoldii]
MLSLPAYLTIALSTAASVMASVHLSSERLPHGGALFSLSKRVYETNLAPRQDLAECGFDCTAQTWGCECGFIDSDWVNQIEEEPPTEPSPVDTPPTPSTDPPPPDASPKDLASVTCLLNKDRKCDCTDGSHPAIDENGFCCIWGFNGPNSVHCFDDKGPATSSEG